MTIIDRILGKQQQVEEPMKSQENAASKDVPRERIRGRIIKLDTGWGFIVSKDIPFTRIFFHWSALEQDTLHFTQLRKHMSVSFEPLEVPEKGIRAIRIKVEEDSDSD